MDKEKISPEHIYEHTREKVNDLRVEFSTKIENLQTSINEINKRFDDWSVVQENRLDALETKMSNKMDKIIEKLSEKSKSESRIMTQIEELTYRLEKVELAKELYDKTMTEISVKVDQLISLLTKYSLDKINQDITNAHEKLRDHEERIRPLEKMAGKFALKLLWYFLTLILGSIAGFLISYLSSQ